MRLTKLGGMTNTNYLLDTGSDKVVIKNLSDIHSDSTVFIDRDAEWYNTREVVDNTDLSYSSFVYMENTYICDYLEGYSPRTEYSLADLSKVTRTLSDLHHSNVNFNNSSDCSVLLDRYQTLTDASKIPDYLSNVDINLSNNIVGHVREVLRMIRDEGLLHLVPSHIDTVPENILISSNHRKAKLIDWEYSGIADRMWDLANFSTEADISMSYRDYLLNSYSNNCADNHNVVLTKVDTIKFMCYTIMSNYVWSKWTLAKISNSSDASPDEIAELINYYMLRISKAYVEWNRYSTSILEYGKSLKESIKEYHITKAKEDGTLECLSVIE